jgi:hypothetical protein
MYGFVVSKNEASDLRYDIGSLWKTFQSNCLPNLMEQAIWLPHHHQFLQVNHLKTGLFEPLGSCGAS